MTNAVPTGWLKAALGDVVEVRDFEREPINSTERSQRIVNKTKVDLFPYYGATGQVGWIDDFRSEGEQVLLGEDGAPFLDPNRDKAYVVSGRYWVNNHAHVLRGVPGAMDNRFLNFQLNLVEYHQFVSGSTRLKLTSAAMKQIPVLVPPALEQTRIVEKLEELLSDLDAGVAELRAAQRKLTQYRQSLLKAAVEGALTADWRAAHRQNEKPSRPSSPRKRGSSAAASGSTTKTLDSRFRGNDGNDETGTDLLQRILTERRTRWETRQLAKFAEQGKTPSKDWETKYPDAVTLAPAGLPNLPKGWAWASVDQLIGSIETGKSFKCEERPPLPSEVGVVKVSAVSWGEYNEQESKTCLDLARVNEELMVKPGDFLFSRANTVELVGACVITQSTSLRVMLSDKILRFVLLDEQLKPWLLANLRSEFGRKQIESLASGNQESMKNIGQERIRQIAIPLPSKSEIVEVRLCLESALDSSVAQIQAVERALKQAAAQRKNILKSAFAGQLVPQDPTDEPASALLERIRAGRVSGGAKRSGKTGRKPREKA